VHGDRFTYITEPYRITLHSAREKLASVYPISVDHTGYSLLVKRLKESNIAGTEDLPEKIEAVRHVLLKNTDFTSVVLFIFQIFLW